MLTPLSTEQSNATPMLPKPANPRYQSLDFWRGAACLLVVVFHSSFYAGGTEQDGLSRKLVQLVGFLWIGVPMFFVISGYCISAAIDSARRRPLALRSYFFRRFRRIYPPYWIFMAGAVLLIASVETWVQPQLFTDAIHPITHPLSLSPFQWIGNLTLTEIWRPNFGYGPAKFLVGHAWTLCYEEQFYAFMGLLLCFFSRRFFMAAALLTIVCMAFRHVFLRVGLPVNGFFFDGQWPMFASGILVYYQVNYGRRERDWLPIMVLVLGMLYSVRQGTGIFLSGYSIDLSAFFAFASAIALLLLHRFDTNIAASSLLQPITLCGTMCYSLYLLHWPISKAISHQLYIMGIRGPALTLLVTVPSCLAASISLAWLFHVKVERRFLNAYSPKERCLS